MMMGVPVSEFAYFGFANDRTVEIFVSYMYFADGVGGRVLSYRFGNQLN